MAPINNHPVNHTASTMLAAQDADVTELNLIRILDATLDYICAGILSIQLCNQAGLMMCRTQK